MKKIYKVILAILAFILIASMTFFIYALIVTKNVKLEENKFVNKDECVVFYDYNEKVFSEESKNLEITPISDIPNHVKNAFIAIEDKRFYSHDGIDLRSLIRASFTNIKTMSFKEGGSTITQQLIKNTHLTSDKTFKRKLSEIKLALKMEKLYSKDEILEKYLNTIYFGNNCFGITEASRYYFDKKPSQLNLSEGATLAGIIKSPATYSPTENYGKCLERRNLILKEMLNQEMISKEDYDYAICVEISVNNQENRVFSYDYLVKKELDNIMDGNVYSGKKLLVYTYYLPEIQQNIFNDLLENSDYNFSMMLTDTKSHVVCYLSSVGEIYRQMGSTIKPLLCYAPAIDLDILDEFSLIMDEKTDFNGYSPSNYNDKYYGNVSVKDALSKSLNVPAVKTLNYVGVNNAKKYIAKTDIPIQKEDEGLSMALGSLSKGATLSQIVSAYNCFPSGGKFNSSVCIKKITDEDGHNLYVQKDKNRQVFSEETISIMNYMLKDTVKSGTAKKLEGLGYDICAKTGTVGTENGNTDAYTISYTSKYCFGVWLGNKKDKLLDNSITGGTIPCTISRKVYNNLYKEDKPEEITLSNKAMKVKLDKISYENGTVQIADDISPERYVLYGFIKNSRIDKIAKSTRFSSPSIENLKTQVNNNEICIKLCLTKCIEAYILKEYNNQKVIIYDTKNKDKIFIDKSLKSDTEYVYYIIPYYEHNGNIIYGKEIKMDKIKTPANAGEKFDNWWDNEF